MRMEEMVKVEVLAKENIKPSSPTPDHLRSFKLSFFDQYAPPHYVSFALFYASSGGGFETDKSRCLKESLSQVLTLYYPLAGRIKDHLSLDCNDQGALYVEARATETTLAALLQQPNVKTFRSLIAESPVHLLIIQATFFGCGGMAIGFSINHRVADGVFMGSLLKAWSNTAVGGTAAAAEPDLTSPSSLFPPLDPPPTEIFKKAASKFSNIMDAVPRRYVFSSSSITSLKAKAASKSVPNPTPVQVVSALIWKCRMTTRLLESASSTRKPSAVDWAVNLRPSLEPPLPEHTFGNIVMLVRVREGDDEYSSTGGGGGTIIPELSCLVERTRSSLQEFRGGGFVKKLLQGAGGGFETYLEGLASLMTDQYDDSDTYINASWCGFPFYQADFGWGKPTWACCVLPFWMPTYANLMDTRDGDGIEVHVAFQGQEQVALFETIKELLQHASLNPRVL